jgi:carbonic anhydrase
MYGRIHRYAVFVGALIFTPAVIANEAGSQATADAALARLKAGNARFVADPAGRLPVDPTRRQELAAGQAPFATVLSCADSRVPPELVFSQGLGDLFVVRAAGHVADHAVLASVEYAAEHLHVPLVVVMGHEACGAVKAAVAGSRASLGPNLDYLIAAIRPAVDRTARDPEREQIQRVVLANVEQTVNDTLQRSAVVAHLVREGKVQIVGAYYELASGRVHFSKPVTGAEPHASHD